MLHNFRFATDHQAVATLQPPYSSADTDIDMMNSGPLKLSRAANVVMVVGVATVYHDIAPLERRCQGSEHRIDRRGRHHQPHGTGPRQTFHERS